MTKELTLTNGDIMLVSSQDFDLLSRHVWYLSNGYPATSIGNTSIYAHKIILGSGRLEIIDHMNGNKLDNRIGNLRIVTAQQNSFNSRIKSTNTSGYKGVSKSGNKWRSYIVKDGKQTYLGMFNNPHDAARMYNFWAIDLFGKYAHLNKIAEEN
jgi:hypothetical protein